MAFRARYSSFASSMRRSMPLDRDKIGMFLSAGLTELDKILLIAAAKSEVEALEVFFLSKISRYFILDNERSNIKII